MVVILSWPQCVNDFFFCQRFLHDLTVAVITWLWIYQLNNIFHTKLNTHVITDKMKICHKYLPHACDNVSNFQSFKSTVHTNVIFPGISQMNVTFLGISQTNVIFPGISTLSKLPASLLTSKLPELHAFGDQVDAKIKLPPHGRWHFQMYILV